jgi:hypothetical protein
MMLQKPQNNILNRIIVCLLMISALCGPALVVLTTPNPVQAVVPVYCPEPCETWDVGITGRRGTGGFFGAILDAVGLGGLASTIGGFFNNSREGHVYRKDVSAIGSLFTNPLGTLWDAASNASSWDSLAWLFSRQILHQFSQGIINWIKTGNEPAFFGGGAQGGSLFVTNIDEFLLSAADNAAGVFLNEYFRCSPNDENCDPNDVAHQTYAALCSPFKLNIGLGLRANYGRDYGSFKFKARCSISDIVTNVENFYDDFSTGGWEAWFKLGSYQNTPWGLLSLAMEESNSRQVRAANANKLDFSAGLGFLGLRTCPPENQLPGPTQNGQPLCKNNGYVTQTPGKAIENQLRDATGWEVQKLGVADEINEVLYAVWDRMMGWVLGGGSQSKGLLGSQPTSYEDPRSNSDPRGTLPSGTTTGGTTTSGGTTAGEPPPPAPPVAPPGAPDGSGTTTPNGGTTSGGTTAGTTGGATTGGATTSGEPPPPPPPPIL